MATIEQRYEELARAISAVQSELQELAKTPKTPYARHREVLGFLQATLKEVKETRAGIEKKAWDLLTIITGTFGIVTGFQVSFTQLAESPAFILIVFVSLMIYVGFLFQINQVVRTRNWTAVPWIPGNEKEYDEFLDTYVNLPEEAYLIELISVHAGAPHPNEPGVFVQGAIHTALENNRDMTYHLKIARRWAAVLVCWLIFCTSLAAFFQQRDAASTAATRTVPVVTATTGAP